MLENTYQAPPELSDRLDPPFEFQLPFPFAAETLEETPFQKPYCFVDCEMRPLLSGFYARRNCGASFCVQVVPIQFNFCSLGCVSENNALKFQRQLLRITENALE